ncbi:hypothetical protein F4810DRAFT_590676 [Camillea tinctor]|nr:hypothetical protein F4810DRAFT_590676 [Camillea tinctor]
MRLDASTFGLLSCFIGLAVGKNGLDIRDGGDTGASGTSTSSSTNSVVVIDTTFPTPATFPISQGDQTIRFLTGAGISNLTISHINLKNYDTDYTIGQGELPTSSLTTGQAGAAGTSGSKRRQTLPPLILPTTENNVTLPFQSQFDDYSSYLNEALYLEFLWYNSTSRGTSTTPVFAIYENNASVAARALEDTGRGNNPAHSESITTSSGASAGSPAATATSEAEQTSSRGSQGLAVGAIAGIAVGCAVAGLLILGALVWFLCRRRRRSEKKRARAPDASYASDSVTQHAMMGEKEIPGISESTPHSTYGGEEGVVTIGRSSLSRNVAAPSPTATPPPPPAGFAAHRPSHSLSDASITHTNTHTTAPRDMSARASTPPVMSRYAHLVEEGMTEDEIRRLEEEERQLDEAIEDAGRHRRTSR